MFNRDGQAGSFDPMMINHQLEALEPRVLLTTLMGGDIFEYIDSQGQTVRVVVEGDAIIELIGGDINNSIIPNASDPSTALVLGDLPGYIYQSDLGRVGDIAGGLGGADGVELVGVINIDDAVNGQPGDVSGPSDDITINALATHSTTGRNWAVNLITLTPIGEEESITMAQIIEFDADTGEGTVRYSFHLVGDIVDNVEVSPVTGIVGAAFDIRTGQENLLYFVTELAGGAGGYDLISVNVNNGTVNDPSRKVIGAVAAAEGQAVNAIAFDRIGAGANSVELVVSTIGKVIPVGGGDPVDAGKILRYTSTGDYFNLVSSGSAVTVRLTGEYVATISGIAFKGDNAAAADRYLYATSAEGLLRIDLNTGFAQNMGPLIDPDDIREVQRGGSIGDLTWDANSVNPFTGEVGVLVGVDTVTDELIYIDDRPRFAEADIYAIYVSQTSENAKISIAVVPAVDPETFNAADPFKGRGMTPYEGSIGSMRVLDISNVDPLAGTIIISAPDGTGGVLIGALTEEVDPLVAEEDLLPIVAATLAESIGVRPAGLDTEPNSAHNLAAGIYVAPSVVEYVNDDGTWTSRLLGSNIDMVTGLAVNRFGTVAGVDTDLSNAGGAFVQDQLFFVDANAKGTGIVTIKDGGGNLTGTKAIAYGFADLTQVSGESDEELYAVINNRFGVLNTTTGFFTQIAANLTNLAGTDLPANAVVRSMAFAPGGAGGKQTLYIVVDENGTDDDESSALYTLTYDVAGGVISGITAAVKKGDITYDNGNVVVDVNVNAITFDASGRLLAQDRDNGRYVQLNTTTAAVTVLAESAVGSLRATVGGFAYDLDADRILVADNATSLTVLANEAGNSESAALMQIKTGASGQNVGTILIGGTITGQVYFSGSIDTFYAGWVVTGATGGQGVSTAEIPQNFYVAGDIRNLVTTATIGTDILVTGGGEDQEAIQYNSGVEFFVKGRLGQIFGGESGIFKTTVQNFDDGVSLSAAVLAQTEVEYRTGNSSFLEVDSPGVAFQAFRLFNGTSFTNDTIETAQIVGTITTGTPGEADVIYLTGSLDSGEDNEGGEENSNSDSVDFYAISLLAGQTIFIRLDDIGGKELPLGVYDPDGRLIASEINSFSGGITITAARPGLYTIGVGQHHPLAYAKPDFNSPPLPPDYALVVTGAGTVSLGGIDLRGSLHYQAEDAAITVESGDLGALRISNTIFFDTAASPFYEQFTDVYVNSGNLRAVVAGQIGNGGLLKSAGINAEVSGSIGLLQTTTGSLSLPETRVGGSIQAIDAFSELMLNVYVNGGIGTIYAGNMPGGVVVDPQNNVFDKSFIRVNYDNLGQDGIIDLIDVDGDFNDVAIITNNGGNVRYIRVGGVVGQDSFFASGTFGTITGTNLSVIDDSGATIRFQAGTGGLIDVTTYGIRGSGGSVVVKAESTLGMFITSTTGQNARPAEISEIVFSGTGHALIVDQERNTVVLERDLELPSVILNISGSSPLDVFSIVGNAIDNISNSTGGELVNIAAKSIGILYAAGSIGIAKQNNNTAVLSGNVIYDTYPFYQQRNAVIAGDFGTIRSDQAIGNVIADVNLSETDTSGTGTIGAIYANNDNRDVANIFEGIAGPIYAAGEIYLINIGEGLAAKGTGEMADSGIFAIGEIGKIVNQGLGSDIRGTIVSTTGIDQVILTGGGSIIQGDILTLSDLAQTIPVADIEYFTFQGSFINKVSIQGNGGIIGSNIISDEITEVSVRGGFGIFNTLIGNIASSHIGTIYADGFGLRGVRIGYGATTDTITAGERSDTPLSISSYTPSVRASEFDPDNATSDNDLLTAILGHQAGTFTSGFPVGNSNNGPKDTLAAASLNAAYSYTAGVIYDLQTQGSLDLGNVRAFHIEDSTFNYANSINSIVTDEDQVNLNVTTGTIKTITAGSSRLRGDIIDGFYVAAGNIDSITAYGDINFTKIVANNNGTLNRLTINMVKNPNTGVFEGGNFTNDSELIITGRVNTIDIAGDIDNSTITVLSGSEGKYAVNKFTLGGSLNGTLELFDDVKSIAIAGSLTGDRLVVGGNLGSLTVGSDRSILGVELGLDLIILGDLGTLTVNGKITGDIVVQGELKKVTISADATQIGTNILSGDISVTEGIGSISIKDGNVSGNIFAGRDLSKFSISNGNFTNTASATSIYGMIKSFSVDGDMDGLIQVDNGELSSLKVTGDMGATAEILALSAKSISVTGHIIGGASFEIERILSSLTAGYIGDGATAVDIIAGGVQSISTRGVRNINDGDLYANLVLGDNGKGTKITASGNFGGTSMIEGDLTLTVKGDVDMDITNGEYLMVAGDVKTLKVSGDLSGGIFVEGEGGKWSANSITNAILTTGFDLDGLTVREGVTNSLVQVGIWAGNDMVFAAIDGQQDLGEVSRRATLGKFTANSVDNSIIASGGDITSISVKNDITDSSVSSGWSVGSLAINERMGGELDGDILREQDGRALFHGSIKSVSASDINDSYITAGVDAGVGGDFSAPAVILANGIRLLVDGGGFSELGSLRGNTNAGSRLVADSGISRNGTSGNAAVNANVTYTTNDLEQGNALAASVGIATQATPLVYTDSGLTVTITVKGDGSVDARDISLADGILDGLVISGTNSKTSITIKTSVPGAVDIGRIFTADDAQLNSFSFDGGIVGDDTTGLDLWFDGAIGTLSLAGFGSETALERVTGAIGSDITTFNLGFQQAGTLRIAGGVKTMTVDAGSGDPLQLNKQLYAGRNFSSLTFDGANVYGVDGLRIYTIDPLNNNNITNQFVEDATTGNGLEIVGLDIDNNTGDVIAVGRVQNQNPTVQISSIGSDLQGLAVRASDGAIFAVRYNPDTDVDQLVKIDATTGGLTVVGTLQDVFGNSYGSSDGSQVMSLAFRDGILLAILTDRDGAAAGGYPAGDDVTIAAISTTANVQGFVRVTSPTGNQALPPVTLAVNAGEIYTGMATNAAGDVFAVRDDNTIVQINRLTGADIDASTFGGLTLTGIGFDIDGNLIGLDTTSNQLYLLDLNTDTATALSTTVLAPGLTAFAIGKTDVNNGFITYAYDDVDSGGVAGDERAFYTNPGLSFTVGIVDPVTGLFTQLAPLAQDTEGVLLEGNVVSLSVDSANNRIKVLTDNGRITTYNINGTLDTGTDAVDLVDNNGEPVTTITKIDYAADGRLLGLDLLSKQLVVINTTTGLVSALTEPGSVQGDVNGFTIDEVTGVGLVFNNTNDNVAAIAGFTQAALGGISAESISRLTVGDDYAGRIATTGNLDTIAVNGDFTGAISAGGAVKTLTVKGGEFSGNVYVAGDISRATFSDADFAGDGLIWTNGSLSLAVSGGSNFDGLLNGKIVAGTIANLSTRNDFNSNATIIATRDASNISLAGDFDGFMELAQLSRSLTIGGIFEADGFIDIEGDAASINLKDGSDVDSTLVVDGFVKSITSGGVFSSSLFIKNGLQKGTFQDLNQAIITIGLDTQTISVRGDVDSSLISLGVWAGDDNEYNTNDDIITGGQVRSVAISGNYRNSITAVGVLPSFNVGSNANPATSNNFIYLGRGELDSAEAGGLVASSLGSFSIRGEISSSNVNTGRVSGVVAADEIGKISTGQTGSILNTRVYTDPYGPVQIISKTQTTNSRFEIILSEPVLSSSVIISVDRNGDNAITSDSGDTQGSIYVKDGNGNIVNNITLTTSTRVIDGVLRGVITGVSATPMAGAVGSITYDFRLSLPTQETFVDEPMIMDRSGLRSALRGFNGDVLGTLLDENGNGFEG